MATTQNNMTSEFSQPLKQNLGAYLSPLNLGQNVGTPERWVSTAASLAALAFGFRSRGFRRLSLLGLGWALAQRGLTGKCSLYKKLGVSTRGPVS